MAKIVGIGANVFDTLYNIPTYPTEDTKMRATASTDALAAMKNTPCMYFSVHAFDFILFYYLIPSISFTNVNCIYLINCHIFCWVV